MAGLLCNSALLILAASWSSILALSSAAPRTHGRKPTMNVIDACWRSYPHWDTHRRKLADCAIGFGRGAVGGKYGATYVVTSAADDPVDPRPGTLRYGAIQAEPLWIIFTGDMRIRLANELMVNSFKTIDGRGAAVEIADGPCITVQHVSHVIIHGVRIHRCTPGRAGPVRSSPAHVGHRQGSDGDAIAVFDSSHVWIDHCSLSHCYDGLVDVIHGSTAVTISNNYFSSHDKVMLFGHDDAFVADRRMRVTVVFNHFGEGLVQRMPRVRHGYAHVVNNRYDPWDMYAIGGSANPTILSEGNYFSASPNPILKQVTKRETVRPWRRWKWRSAGDKFVDGAYFIQSGWGSAEPAYTEGQAFAVAGGSVVPSLTADAGPLPCVPGKPCTR